MLKAQLRLDPRAGAKAHVLDLLPLLLMLSLPRLPASVPLKPVQTLGPSASAFLSLQFLSLASLE